MLVLLWLDHIEGEVVVLAPHGQVSDLLPIRSLIVVGDQAYHCCVISKLNYGVGHAVMSEQGVQEGTEHTHLRGPCVVTYPYTWIQLQREVFSPRVRSLLISFEGTMVLNAELYSMNTILTAFMR